MNRRAASNVIGFLLIFSLVASVIAIVSVTGVDALNDIKEGEQSRNAERAFDVLSDNLNDVHREGAPSRATEISLQDAQIDTTGTATINITGWDSSDPDTNFTVNRTVNPIVWQPRGGGDTRISYEFGAVIREQRQGGIVVTEPPFQMATDRTILPVIDTDGFEPSTYSGTTLRVRGVRNTPRIITTGEGSMYDNLKIEITSPRADIWASYLEREPGTSCSLGDAPGERDRVTCDLDTRDQLYIAVYPVTVEIAR